MGTSPIAVSQSPPLGGSVCPDPRYGAGRYLVLQGPSTFLGPRWVFTASLAGQPAVSPGPAPPLLPGIPEGAIPFVEVAGALELGVAPPEGTPEGATAYVEDTAT